MSDEALIEAMARAACEATSGPFDRLSPEGQEAMRTEQRAALDAAAAVLARTEVSDAAFSAGVYAVADVLCASQYVNAPDASFVLTLAHHAFAAGIAAQAATPTEAK